MDNGNLIIYKILFHQYICSYPIITIFSSPGYPVYRHVYVHVYGCLWLSQPKFIVGVQRAFEECLKCLRKLYLNSSVTWCRYQIAATNSYSSFSKDGWTKPYFLFIQPVKSLSISLTILQWSWYRWVPLPTIPPTPEPNAGTLNHGLERHSTITVLAVEITVSLSPLVAPTLNLMQGWSPFAAATTQVPHHHPVAAPKTLVPFPLSPVTGQKRFSSCHIHQQHHGHKANAT